MTDHTYQAAIVGAGPIGLELAVAMKRAGIDYLHLDAKQIGYTISWYAPQTRFFSSNERIAIAGVPLVTPEQQKATREQYLAYLRGIVEQFDLHIHTYEPVTDIVRNGLNFEISTAPSGSKRTWRARSVILATGGTDRPRMLNVPGEDLPHVSHYFDDPHKYFRRNLLIVGGRNSAVEAALRCHNAGARVSFSYRRESLVEKSIKYWLLPEFKSLAQTGRLKTFFGSHVKRITPTEVELVMNNQSAFTVATDFALLLTGYEQDNALFRKAGVALDGPTHQPHFDPETMQTNVPRLYVAGTAIGGTQERFSVFIENCHDHVDKIMRDLFGVKVASPQLTTATIAPES
jgi:thioredoxin reductase (NADPH)